MPLTLKELAGMNKNAPGLDGTTHLIAYGIPAGYSFRDSGSHNYSDVLVPPNYAGATIYIHNAPREDKPNPPAKSMESRDGQLWFRVADTKRWINVQSPGAQIAGFFEKTDFRGNTGHPFPITQGNPAKLQTPVREEIGHWWPFARGGITAPIDAVFGVHSLRVLDPAVSGIIIAQCGLDWWTNTSSGTNTAAGLSDWRMITSDWLDFGFIHYKGYTPEGVEEWLKNNPIPYTYAADGTTTPPIEPPIEPPVGGGSGSGVEIYVDGVKKTSGEVTFRVEEYSSAQRGVQTQRRAAHMVDEQKEAAKVAREETEKQEKAEQEALEAQNKPPPQSVDTETPPGDKANLPHAAENTSPPHKPSPSDPASGGMRGTDDMPGKESEAKPKPVQAPAPSGMKKEEDKSEPGSHKK